MNHFNIITWQNITKSMIKFHSAAVHVTPVFLSHIGRQLTIRLFAINAQPLMQRTWFNHVYITRAPRDLHFYSICGPAASVKHKINLVWPNQYQIDVSNVMTAVRNSRYRQLVQRYLMLLQTVECFCAFPSLRMVDFEG